MKDWMILAPYGEKKDFRYQGVPSEQWKKVSGPGDRPRQHRSGGTKAKPGPDENCWAGNWHCRSCLASSAAETSPKLW